MSEEIHNLTNTVIAIVDDRDRAGRVMNALSAVGFDAEILEGADGRAHLDPRNEDVGLWANLRKVFRVFGDQARVMQRFDRALESGSLVVSVGVESEDDAARASHAMSENGAHDAWRFGGWTQSRVGN
jgi:hypothetical protein